MTGELEQKATEIITQLQHLAPKAADLALQTARMDALSSFAQDFLALALCVAIILFWRSVYWPWVQAEDQSDMGEVPRFLAGAALGIAGAVLGSIAIFGLCDPWLYAAYFHPELWLAHKIIG